MQSAHELALLTRGWPTWARYLCSTLLVAAVIWGLRLGGADVATSFLIMIALVLFCSLLLDRGNGLYATALSGFLYAFFLLPPPYSFAVAAQQDQLDLVLFLVLGATLALIVEALHTGLVNLALEHELAQTAARDRELLLDELTHRIKNEFASISALLEMQARSGGEQASALRTAAERVRTYARVHRRLELLDSRIVVDTQTYLNELADDLRATLLALRPIALRCRPERHFIGVEKALPLALIVNELVTNAAKHAFPDDRNGIIEILFAREEKLYRLTVSDNGVGITGKPRPDSLGHKLLHLLSAQLGGSVDIASGAPGTVIVVRIPVLHGAKKTE